MNFNRVTLQHNNEFTIIIFCYLIVSVITMCKLIKRLICAHFLVLLQAMFMNDENKQHVQAIKIARETTKKYNSVKHLQRQQFSFT